MRLAERWSDHRRMLHAIASITLTTFTCTCGLSFGSLLDLTTHITAGNAAAPASTATPTTYIGRCGTSGCGHPRVAHPLDGRCRIRLGTFGETGPCTCRRFTA